MEKNLIHSNELHFIDKKRIHRAVGQLVESLELAAGSTTGFNLYAVVESYFTDLNKRREINRLLNPEQNTCEETEEEQLLLFQQHADRIRCQIHLSALHAEGREQLLDL